MAGGLDHRVTAACYGSWVPFPSVHGLFTLSLPASRELHVVGRIIVPLDGSSAAERAIPLATSLAERLQAEVRLVRAVLPEHGRAQVDHELVEIAEAYLRLQQEEIWSSSTCQLATVVREGIPVEVVIDQRAMMPLSS